MRISGGIYKGRKVAGKRCFSTKKGGDELRPTSAKVRAAVFNILREHTQGAVFLDLYAGTGAVGIEALSRGAAQVFLVEHDPVRYRAIEEYVRQIKAADRVTLSREKVEFFIRRASSAGARFDLIFADPPYASGEALKILEYLDVHDVLTDGGYLMVEHSSKTELPMRSRTLMLARSYRYGDTTLSLFRKTA